MAVKDIIFTQGQSEGIDPKLLPDGLFSSAQNVRFRKDGRIGSRNGFSFISNSPLTAVGAGNFGPARSIYIRGRLAASVPAKAYDRRDDGTYTTVASSPVTPSSAPSLGVPLRRGIARNLQYTAVASDLAYVNGYIVAAVHDYQYVGTLQKGLSLLALHPTSHSIVGSLQVSTVALNPKLVVVGTQVVLFYALVGSDVIQAITYSVGGAPFFSPVASNSVVTAFAGRSRAFDAAAYDGTRAILGYQQATANIRWGTVLASTNVFTTVQNIATTDNAEISLVKNALNTNVSLVWLDHSGVNGDVKYAEQTIAGAPVVATTTIDSTGFAFGRPVAGVNATSGYSFAWPTNKPAMGVFIAGGAAKFVSGIFPVCRPFTGPVNGCHIWTTNYGGGLTSIFTTSLDSFATYKLIDLASIQDSGTAAGAVCEAIACQMEAMPGAYVGGTDGSIGADVTETRRSCISVPTVETVPSGGTAFAVALPVRNTTGFGVDMVRIDQNASWTNQFFPAHLNGKLYFSGGQLSEFDGLSFYESGLPPHESILLADGGAGGGQSAGTYQYALVRIWNDAQGQRHISAPSAPQSITIAAGRKVTISWQGPPYSTRFAYGGAVSPGPGISTLVYRTQTGGSTFFLVNDAEYLIQTAASYDQTIYAYTDSATDASIADNEKLYTQGIRGGLSGTLPNDMPPACRYIWAGNNRLLMGGLEDPAQVQWSKLVFPGEPTQFTIDPGFTSRIDGEVTGIGCLDGTWFVGSRDAIFAITGDGPDDNGSGGQFNDPVRVPADVGFYSQRSIVEIQEGLLFQGRADRLYLLPRGGGAPIWIGQPVRDTLAAYPFIAAAKLVPDENLVYFSCINAAGDNGVFIVYDTRNKQWSVDTLYRDEFGTPFSSYSRVLDVFNGKLVLSGVVAETSAFADSSTGAVSSPITCSLITGDIRPFGPLGHGRVRKMTMLGEARDVLTAFTPTINISYDSGKTFADPGSWAIAALAAAIGDSIEAEHMLLYPKGDTYRVKLSWTTSTPTEGIVWNALSLEYYPEQGVHRQANARRG